EGTMITALETIVPGDSLTLPSLYDWMLQQKEKISSDPPGREVMIQSDKEIEFEIVKRVMYTCSKAGYDDFTILVMQEG
ncbi:MAG: hypothetical protein GF344_18320, partial [Chitinivibrionales bacterium]|nr:hypothetical protein [Chitinivibrionales bacterium]MBD3358614.1 hypothetical protein [Chitinivibrionales bacterium]